MSVRTTSVSVPKASMDKQRLHARWKYNIGSARQPALVKAKSIAEFVQQGSQNQLRLCIFAFDGSHQAPPRIGDARKRTTIWLDAHVLKGRSRD